MIPVTRTSAAILLMAAWTTGLVFAQGGQPAPTPAPQGQTAAPGGRGAGPAPDPAAQGRGRVNAPPGGRRGGYTQYTRPLASQEVLIRGKALYDATCASCHQVDMRGTADGQNPNLLRSGVALRDVNGELIGERVAKHTPRLNIVAPDMTAIAEYIHSVHATMGGQGSPPGRNPTNVTLEVLVGEAAQGKTAFDARCGQCHSATGNLAKIGSRFPDARALQNAWVSGSASVFGGGRGGGGAPVAATVTMANGQTLQGMLVRQDDFNVVLNLTDGTRRVIPRDASGNPKVQVNDPRAGHVDAIVKLAHEDTTSSIMHNITAYLWTIK
jgi:cytochrome c oxidase cbb3-type subunit 3